MCIAFPKAADGNERDEPAWKSALLLIPRVLGLVWLVLKIIAGGMKNRVLESRH
jgi:hypothetical protein